MRTVAILAALLQWDTVIEQIADKKTFVVYEPHAECIRYLFKRYRELNGNLPRLGRELRATGFMFPAFDGVEKPCVALKFKNGGYPCYTRKALQSILTNPIYIGWYVYGGAIISETHHEPIVDMATFMYAFSRLSPVNLDGTPNANKPVQNRRYGPVSGLLDTLLFYNGDPCYAMRKQYVARHKTDNWDSTTLVVSLEQIDFSVSNAILVVLYALDFRHQQGLQDSLYEQLEAMAQEKRAEGVSLGTALKNIDIAIHGWELDKVSSRETGNKTGLDEANRELARLYQVQGRCDCKRKRGVA